MLNASQQGNKAEGMWGEHSYYAVQSSPGPSKL